MPSSQSSGSSNPTYLENSFRRNRIRNGRTEFRPSLTTVVTSETDQKFPLDFLRKKELTMNLRQYCCLLCGVVPASYKQTSNFHRIQIDLAPESSYLAVCSAYCVASRTRKLGCDGFLRFASVMIAIAHAYIDILGARDERDSIRFYRMK